MRGLDTIENFLAKSKHNIFIYDTKSNCGGLVKRRSKTEESSRKKLIHANNIYQNP